MVDLKLQAALVLLAFALCSCGTTSPATPGRMPPGEKSDSASSWEMLCQRPVGGVLGITFSQDGRFARILDSQQHLEVWDLQKRKPIFRKDQVIRASWDEAGKILQGRRAGEYFSWSSDTSQKSSLDLGIDEVQTGHSHWAITREASGQLVLWDLAKRTRAGWLGHPDTEVLKHLSKLESVFMTSETPERIFAKLPDHRVLIWGVEKPERFCLLKPHHGEAYQVVFSRDRSRVLTRGQHRALVWDAVTGRLLCQLGREPTDTAVVTRSGKTIRTAKWHEECSFSQAVFSADGRRAVTLGTSARLWDATSGERLADLEPDSLRDVEDVNEVHLSPDGHTLCLATQFGTRGGRVWLWDLKTGKLQADLQADLTALDDPVRPTRLFTISGQTAQVRDLSGGKLLATLPSVNCRSPIDWSETGDRLVLADRQSWRLSLWDLNNGQRLGHYSGWLVASADKQLVIIGPEAQRQDRVTLVDGRTGRTRGVLQHEEAIDGSWDQAQQTSRLVTCSPDGTVFLWDSAEAKVLLRFRPHDGPVAEVRLSPDGRTLVTRGQKDRQARLWQLRGDRS